MPYKYVYNNKYSQAKAYLRKNYSILIIVLNRGESTCSQVDNFCEI